MTIGLDLSGALLSVTWRTIGTHQVLAVYDDRSAWYWAMATTGPGADLIGSFRAEVPADRWSFVVALAGDNAVLSNQQVPGELGISIGSGEGSGWVALGTEQAGRIGDAVLPLVQLALDHPVAAARLETRLVTSPIGQRLAGFTLASIGERPVSLRLDPQQFALSLSVGEWLALPPPRMGLVDPAGTLLDGIYTTAEIAPGFLGACTIVLDDAAAGLGGGPGMRGAMRGSLILAGPWPHAPVEPFEASSEAQAIVVP
jgi:hypothetical protein